MCDSKENSEKLTEEFEKDFRKFIRRTKSVVEAKMETQPLYTDEERSFQKCTIVWLKVGDENSASCKFLGGKKNKEFYLRSGDGGRG